MDLFDRTENPRPETGNRQPPTRRGQAAMEYLMTYGWAILVIVIVLAILAYFLPSLTKVPDTCQFTQPGFSCSAEPGDYGIIANESNNNYVYAAVKVSNGKGKRIILHSVLCTTASASEAADEGLDAEAKAIGDPVAAGASKQFDVPCIDKDGNEITMSPGEGFRGTLILYYNFEPDVVTVNRTADAIITGTVLKG